MKELIEYIAGSLVDNPSQVDVFEMQRGNQVILQLQVAKEDMGRIIGREGSSGQGFAGLPPRRSGRLTVASGRVMVEPWQEVQSAGSVRR